MTARESSGDGHLAVALNESALYLGSVLGAGIGGAWLSFEASQRCFYALACSAARAACTEGRSSMTAL